MANELASLGKITLAKAPIVVVFSFFAAKYVIGAVIKANDDD
jgi:hypothetical protein